MTTAVKRTTTTIGIWVHAEPQRLHATLASARVHAPEVDVVLLPDGPDEPTEAALASIDLPQLGTPKPRGAPACWNRLVTATNADVVVLLESGSVLAPGAIEFLLAALRKPAHGLSGPSTNMAWNQQAAFRGAADGEAAIAATARVARARFGDAIRPLTPLHSLADFCFAVRRDVIEAVGAADEAYGLGPCWEMDYNIRAARAGFLGVWACAAYVHRALTTRRRIEEANRFEASKHRYQDKFCARRLRGEHHAYEPHCRGDDCMEFAPSGLIQIREPLTGATTDDAATVPLISCIMPTADRPAFIPLSVRSFLAQDWPNRELLVVDDGRDAVDDLVAGVPGVRYLRLPQRASIGAKRNLACRQARGELIVHWDDDDWYAPSRLTWQATPIVAGRADVTGLESRFTLRFPAGQFWTAGSEQHHRMFFGDVHCGTLMFRRSIFTQGVRYPDASQAEDAAFLHEAMRRGHRLVRLENPDVFVYVRHGSNTWRFEPEKFPDRQAWVSVAGPPSLSSETLEAYRAAAVDPTSRR
jgi:O-antigen biosynthesis protein